MADVRILIGEDNELVAQALDEQVRSLGYEVAGIARTSRELVRLYEEIQPELVILDTQMGDLGGDVPQQLAAGGGAPLLIITPFSDAASIRRAEQAGALAYLVKPLNPEELPPAIAVALARHREIRQLREHVGELQETIESRKLIERAKGILMKRLHISDAEAEERLRQRARDKKVKVKEIAQAIVESDALLS